MLLSVIINTYERPESLSRCLQALTRQKEADPFEVVVVDDGGRLDLKAIERVYQDKLDLRLRRIEHAGRAAARNAGIRWARGERILFLGDDVIVRPGCLARHRLEHDPAVARVGPFPLAEPPRSPALARWAEPNPQHLIADPTNAGFLFCSTGNLSIDRERIVALGGFDERFARYGWEDIDLGLRFEREGGRIVFDPEARAVHDHRWRGRAALWRREREAGYTAFQFWSKWQALAPGAIRSMKFWDDAAALRPGPPWRRELGDWLVALTEKIAPRSAVHARLVERMIFAARLEGVHEAWRDAQAGAAWAGARTGVGAEA